MKKFTKIVDHPVTYSLLVDILSLSLLVAAGFIISETFLPGIISVYISPFILFACVTVLLVVTIFVAHRQNISFEKKTTPGTTMLFLLTIGFFGGLIAIASYRYGLVLGAIATIVSMIIMILFLRMFTNKLQ